MATGTIRSDATKKSAKKAARADNTGFLGKIFAGAVGVIVVPSLLLFLHRYIYKKENVASDIKNLQSALDTLQAALSRSSADSAVTTLSGPVVDFAAKHPDGALVEFHMPGCEHCKKLAPEYEAAAKNLSASGGPPLASIDGEAYPEVAKQHGVTRYPTVLWFRRGEAVQELRPTSRTKDKIMEFVDWVQQPAYTEFETLAEFEEAVPQLRQALEEKSPPVVVGFANAEGAPMQETLEHVGQRLRGKALLIYVKEPGSTESLRRYSQNAEDDSTFQDVVSPETVQQWVESFLPAKKEKQ